jgi:hypothetical protein
MGNECYNWFHIKSQIKESIQKIYSYMLDNQSDGGYGFYSLNMSDTEITGYCVSKWEPIINEYEDWILQDPTITIYGLFKEEFLHFAGSFSNDTSVTLVDFNKTSSRDVEQAQSGLLYDLNEKLFLSEHMEQPESNDNYDINRQLLETSGSL